MSIILGSIAVAIAPALVSSVVKGLFGVYRDSKDREYATKSLDKKLEGLNLALLRNTLEDNKEQRENNQKDYHNKLGKLEDNRYFLDNAWPLTMPPVCFSTPKKSDNKIVFRVILAQSTDKEYQNHIGDSVKNRLHSVISKFADRPIQFYLDSWKSDFNNNNLSIDGLFQIMKMQPTLVIIPILSDNGETLIIRTAFWGFGIDTENPTSIEFLKIPLGRIKRDVSREFAKRWREFKSTFTEAQAILDINPIDNQNLDYLIMEEKFINKEVSIDNLEKQTKIYSNYRTDDDRMYEDVTNYVVANIESVISFITDVYCNMEYGYNPTMPYVLSTLNHASYLPSVAQNILPLYNHYLSLIDGKNIESIMNIDCYKIQELIEKIKYLLDISRNGLIIDSKSCATRLIWDEYLSDQLKNWLGRIPNDDMKNEVRNYVYKIVTNLDAAVNQETVDRFVNNLSIDKNKDSIIFSIISRHTIIREFQFFMNLASYRIFVNTGQKTEGINWLTAYCLAEKIVNRCQNLDTHKLNFTPAMFLGYVEYEKEFEIILEETLSEWKIINNHTRSQKFDFIEKCLKDNMLIENLRRMADLLLSFDQEEKKRQ